MQRKRAHDLLAVAARYGSFPIMLETYRECLQDVFDLPALVELARRVRRRELRLVTVDTAAPSPFAASLLFGYVANYLYDGDAPLAERRAQALPSTRRSCASCWARPSCASCSTPRRSTSSSSRCRRSTETQRAQSADRLHDLLLRLGDLTLGRDRARAVEPGRRRGRGWQRRPLRRRTAGAAR